jgi:geranylgeranyl diphosphate synthase type II
LNIEDYKRAFLSYMSQKVKASEPIGLYEPVVYIMNLGGKRLRPILTLMSCELFDGQYKKALDASLAIEMFHNFSLVHDDIMDNAPLRRGKATVHEKWNLNTGILSGDAMLVLANQLFESYNDTIYKRLMKIFNDTALKVCEGQQLDIDFETRNDVSIAEYLKMIAFKTAVLVAASLKMGALIAKASVNEAQKIYDYGLNLGIAFQLQDDFLDVFGKDDFGKKRAGDIIENKKTWMYLKTLSIAEVDDKNRLTLLYNTKMSNAQKIKEVVLLFEKYEIPTLIKAEIECYTEKAFKNCNELDISNANKKILIDFGTMLMDRKI